MSNDAGSAAPAAATSDRGVVDPLRIPGAAAAGAAWRGSPIVARVFVTLTIVDIVGRLTGILDPLALEPFMPMTLVFALLPHDLLILLPALVLARRPDAAEATPLIFRGAIILAVVEFVRFVVGSLPVDPGRGGESALLTWTIQSALGTVLMAAGWLTVAVGLAKLTPPHPRPSVEGLANLVGGALGIGAVAWLLELLIAGPFTFSGDSAGGMLFLASAILVVQMGVWAYLGRVVVRGLGDSRRSQAAVVTAAVAMSVAAVGAALLTIEAAAVAAQILLNLQTGFRAGSMGLGWFGDGLVVTALVVAFGLGLGDNAVRMPRRGGEPGSASIADDDAEPLHWPAPGGEVPAYRAPEPLPDSGRKPTRTKGRRTKGSTT